MKRQLRNSPYHLYLQLYFSLFWNNTGGSGAKVCTHNLYGQCYDERPKEV